MKILFLTLYDENGASSQVRVYQFIKYFEKMGLNCTIKPLLDKKNRKQIGLLFSPVSFFIKLSALWRIIMAYLKRYSDVVSARHYDAILVQKDVLLFGLQELLLLFNKNIIFEFDDAIWNLSKEEEKRPFFIQLFYKYRKNRLLKILKKSKIVLAENSYLAKYARKYNQRVEIISAPIDTAKFKPTHSKKTAKIILGWIGSPSTTYLLRKMASIFEILGQKYKNIELHNIGGSQVDFKNILVKNIKWDNKTILHDLAQIDIGLMPLDNSEINKGRLGYKMIIYCSLGIPTVAKDVGLNRTVIKNGFNGYLTNSTDDWIKATSRLIENRKIRERLGKNARSVALDRFNINTSAKKYANLFIELKKGSSYGK